MLLKIKDFNNANALFAAEFLSEWQEIEQVLSALPLHLKASDQKGIQGRPIFDVVGTNEYIKKGLGKNDEGGFGWSTNIPIPEEFNFLGTDVDFAKRSVLAEAQFSNYPFLLNNLLRSELFYKADVEFAGEPVRVAVIITKAGMFPASNSTLYYEQAERQLTALTGHSVFDVPIRLVGLFESRDTSVPAVWTKYSANRYSRTVLNRDDVTCEISGAGARCRLKV